MDGTGKTGVKGMDNPQNLYGLIGVDPHLLERLSQR